jgi:hypothetical protein
VPSVFFEPAGINAFVAMPATAGSWSAQSQHSGPLAALAARALEPHEPCAVAVSPGHDGV